MAILETTDKFWLFPKQLNNRVYIAGFANQSFKYLKNENLKFNEVSENHIGFPIVNELYTIAGYRINSFYPQKIMDWVIDLEYNIIS